MYIGKKYFSDHDIYSLQGVPKKCTFKILRAFDRRPEFWARSCQLIWCPGGGLVGGCDARAVSRKTPIYFIIKYTYSYIYVQIIHFEFVLKPSKYFCMYIWQVCFWHRVNPTIRKY